MIKINELKKNYAGKNILAIKNEQILDNKIYGLFGRNGAGKTTLINILSNKIFAEEMDIEINGSKLSENLNTSGLVYVVSNDNYLDRNLKLKKILKNFCLINENFNINEAKRYCSIFNLNLNVLLNTLSKGNEAIFNLCIGLAMDVRYIFYDEATNGLDANNRDIFYKLLLENYSIKEKTIVFSTHIIEEVSTFIEEVIFLDDQSFIINKSVDKLKEIVNNDYLSLEEIFLLYTSKGVNI